METIKASHITQIRTYLRIDPRDIRNERMTHLCHNNVAIKHSATMAQIGKFADAAASVISVPSPPNVKDDGSSGGGTMAYFTNF